MLNSDIVSIKALRSLAGKSTNVATLLYMRRPFLNQIWAALSTNDTHSTNAPAHCVWTKLIVSSLSWRLALIRRQKGTISRTFTYNSCFGLAAAVTITTDASIWGYGGWISVNGRAIAYFSETVSKDDEFILELKRGEPESQQGFEAIALSIAVRLWLPFGKSKRFSLAIRNDNIGASTICSSLKGKSGPMNAVAREFSLDIAEGSFEPLLVQHLPGVSNTVADLLSRKTDPHYSSKWRLPLILQDAQQMSVPPRPAG